MPKTAGLFSGIGALELGFEKSGFRNVLLSENDPYCSSILGRRFPSVDNIGDVFELSALPDVDVLLAGFPCQPYSPAGELLGLRRGRRHIEKILELLRRPNCPSLIVLENVPFILHLQQGAAIRFLIKGLASLGYSWAYRIVDTLQVGLPQRRKRWILVASQDIDARCILLQTGDPKTTLLPDTVAANGFYWTEGNSGLGWAENAIPPLKGGSGWGIASSPAIWEHSSNLIFTPDIRDAERLQGLPVNWTKPSARKPINERRRWHMVGNAVSVPTAEWIANAILQPGSIADSNSARSITRNDALPHAAFGWGRKMFAAQNSPLPKQKAPTPILEFLRYEGQPLSLRATQGFRQRFEASRLRERPSFLKALLKHESKMRRIEKKTR